jgi:hypothetical protein
MKLLGIISMDFKVTDQLQVTGTELDTGEKCEYNGTIYELLIDYEKVCDSVRRELLYNILIKFGVPMKLITLIKNHLNKTYIKPAYVQICQVNFQFPMVRNKGMLYRHSFSTWL